MYQKLASYMENCTMTPSLKVLCEDRRIALLTKVDKKNKEYISRHLADLTLKQVSEVSELSIVVYSLFNEVGDAVEPARHYCEYKKLNSENAEFLLGKGPKDGRITPPDLRDSTWTGCSIEILEIYDNVDRGSLVNSDSKQA